MSLYQKHFINYSGRNSDSYIFLWIILFIVFLQFLRSIFEQSVLHLFKPLFINPSNSSSRIWSVCICDWAQIHFLPQSTSFVYLWLLIIGNSLDHIYLFTLFIVTFTIAVFWNEFKYMVNNHLDRDNYLIEVHIPIFGWVINWVGSVLLFSFKLGKHCFE